MNRWMSKSTFKPKWDMLSFRLERVGSSFSVKATVKVIVVGAHEKNLGSKTPRPTNRLNPVFPGSSSGMVGIIEN